MPRWLMLSIGLALVAVALYALLDLAGVGPPLDAIDDESEDRLERVIRRADREERRAP